MPPATIQMVTSTCVQWTGEDSSALISVKSDPPSDERQQCPAGGRNQGEINGVRKRRPFGRILAVPFCAHRGRGLDYFGNRNRAVHRSAGAPAGKPRGQGRCPRKLARAQDTGAEGP